MIFDPSEFSKRMNLQEISLPLVLFLWLLLQPVLNTFIHLQNPHHSLSLQNIWKTLEKLSQKLDLEFEFLKDNRAPVCWERNRWEDHWWMERRRVLDLFSDSIGSRDTSIPQLRRPRWRRFRGKHQRGRRNQRTRTSSPGSSKRCFNAVKVSCEGIKKRRRFVASWLVVHVSYTRTTEPNKQ